ncbi:hypothetical protein [Pararhizobium sp. IMCC21322]|uniref:hypothetical protein n=1 Tax=Pararhizobium sp. IMCC21322 TaxID=3067903 RepID=UPI002740BFD7|nr:hypothetical protein [Pararhizobium sp. IMCC21322]
MPNPKHEAKAADTGGRTGWIVAGIVICLLLVGGYVFRDTIFGEPSDDVNLNVELPGD